MPSSWPQRFLRAIPPMPDGLWVGFLAVMLFLVGMCAGMTLCMHQQAGDVQRLSLQHQLDALDKRLRTLEHRPHE